MKTGLAGKTALITGGSQGIGKAIARSLAQEGVRVGICARSRKTLDDTAREIAAETGSEVVVSAADCTDPGQISRMVSDITGRLGRIDILVNAVGRAKAGPFLDLTDEDWLQTINLKLMSAVRVTRQILPGMLAAKWGRIIMVGGVFGTQPSSFSIPMGAVNAGLFNFTKAIAADVARHNVLVNAISPGRVDTPLFRQLVERQSEQFKISHADALASILAEVPIGRAAAPDEIAGVATFLASDLASYVAGQIVTVDGCWVKGI